MAITLYFKTNDIPRPQTIFPRALTRTLSPLLATIVLHTHVWVAIASYRKGGKKALIRAINAITPVLVFHEEWHGMMLIKTGKKFSSGFEFQFGHSNTALQMFAGIYRDSAGVSCNICRENPAIFTDFPCNICNL